MPRAVVLLSGGLDSYTAAAVAAARGDELCALTFRYGQVHRRELEAARRVAAALAVSRHLVLDIDLAAIGGSSLTGSGEIPKDRPLDTPGIPSTYVPARNTIFLAIALGWAEAIGADTIVLGINAVDYSGYPDCRPEFLNAFEALAALATRAGVEGRPIRIEAPLVGSSKAAIIRAGLDLGLDYGLTHSCYDPLPDGAPCGRCDSCRLRAAGFAEAGAADPLTKDADKGHVASGFSRTDPR
jgi:7-cyano-7-deazaguanine synthase